MKRSLFWAAVEAAAKATRSGFGTVAALVDCGIPRQHLWADQLADLEEDVEVWEAPLSADFTDEALAPTCRCVTIVFDEHPQDSRTNAGATCNRAVEETSEGASPPAAPSDVLGVPTFEELQGTCSAYLAAHEYRKFYGALYGECSCGVEFGSVGQWREHVSELQASALSFAVQDARNTK